MALEDAADVIIKSLLIEGKTVHREIADSLIGADMKRTVSGAPTLTLKIHDPLDRMVQSGMFTEQLTAQVDGRGFALVAIDRSPGDPTLTVTFEDLAVHEMRKHTDPVSCEPNTMTRLDFARKLLDEDGTAWIKIYPSPGAKLENTKVQLARGTVASSTEDKGIDPNYFGAQGGGAGGGTITGPEVARYAAAAGFTGNDLVIAVAVAKAESKWNTTADNTGTNDNGSVDYGLWQINTVHKKLFEKYNNKWMDPAINAKMAYEVFKGPTGWGAWVTYNKGYHKQYMAEAQAAVGNVTSLSDATGKKLTASQKNKSNRDKLLGGAEDTWDAIKRIFAEINWSVYVDFDGGNKASIFVGPDDAFTSNPDPVKVGYDTAGVTGIGYNYDMGKSTATATILCRSTRWQLPPGTAVNLPMPGHLNPWLVSDISRSLFSTQCTVTLKKPEPALPEPEAPDPGQTGVLSDYFGDGGALAASDPTSGAVPNTQLSGKGNFKVPVNRVAVITDQFGAPRQRGRTHQGIDYGVPLGTPVYASRDGTVSLANESYDPSGYGKLVMIQHFGGSETYYGHLSKIGCTKGLPVKTGDLIGLSGQSGNPSGPCLHFEIRMNGKPVNPIPLLNDVQQTSAGRMNWY